MDEGSFSTIAQITIKLRFKMPMLIHVITMICSVLDVYIFVSVVQEGSMSCANELLPQSGVMM